MSKIVSFLLIFIVSTQIIQAQSAWYLPTTHPKFITSHKVMTQLYRISGDLTGMPSLQIEKTGANIPIGSPVAYYNATLQEITLEEEVYDICRSFGKDSLHLLAFILGHELAHHTQQHNGGFACAFLSYKAVTKDSLNTEIERNADKLGNFYARLAAFSPCGISTSFIEKIYQQFSITNTSNTQYPSLQERQNMAITACEEADTLIKAFDLLQNAKEKQLYQDEILYADYLLHAFPSKESYLNAAVARLHWIVNEGFDASDSLLHLPLLFDKQTHFRTSMLPNDIRNALKMRKQYLSEGQNLLQKCLQIDENYPLAWIYDAYLQYLQAKIQKKELPPFVSFYEKMPSDYYKTYYYLVEGIYMTMKHQKAMAIQVFQDEKVTRFFPEEATYNLRLLSP